jgi:hypothetical protein
VLPLAPPGVWDRVLQALQADADTRGQRPGDVTIAAIVLRWLE